MTIEEIVRQFLTEHGYDGLVSVYSDCSCETSDLFPCGEMSLRCKAGYKVACDCGEHDFHISPVKEVSK